MKLYLDSSAYTKGYLEEEGSPAVEELLGTSAVTATSLIAYAEVCSALARVARNRIISRVHYQLLRNRFDEEWQLVVELDVTRRTVAQAAELALRYGLRAYDAVHLASALEWQDAIGEPVTFATFDRALHRAADEAGLVAWPDGLGA